MNEDLYAYERYRGYDIYVETFTRDSEDVDDWDDEGVVRFSGVIKKGMLEANVMHESANGEICLNLCRDEVDLLMEVDLDYVL